jgi:hypothetical protein
MSHEGSLEAAVARAIDLDQEIGIQSLAAALEPICVQCREPKGRKGTAV